MSFGEYEIIYFCHKQIVFYIELAFNIMNGGSFD